MGQSPTEADSRSTGQQLPLSYSQETSNGPYHEPVEFVPCIVICGQIFIMVFLDFQIKVFYASRIAQCVLHVLPISSSSIFSS
jgi:hypothetical protein